MKNLNFSRNEIFYIHFFHRARRSRNTLDKNVICKVMFCEYRAVLYAVSKVAIAWGVVATTAKKQNNVFQTFIFIHEIGLLQNPVY